MPSDLHRFQIVHMQNVNDPFLTAFTVPLVCHSEWCSSIAEGTAGHCGKKSVQVPLRHTRLSSAAFVRVLLSHPRCENYSLP